MSFFRLFFLSSLGGVSILASELGKSLADTKLESIKGTLERIQSRADIQMENRDIVGNIVLASVVINDLANLLATPVNDPVMAIEWLWSTISPHRSYRETNVS